MVFNLFLAFLIYFVFEVVITAPEAAPTIAIINGKVIIASFSKPSIDCSPGVCEARIQHELQA